MKRIFTILFLIPLIGISQDYQLDFNSATLDYVEIPNASSVIANKTEFTISGWVNPQMDASHSGFFGFRNNSDADFFLLQLQNSTNVEARFRNSAGINFDVLANSILDIGQWQHLAFTYDGSYIKLYKNGSMVDSSAANGTITNVSQSFKIGSLEYQSSSFPMQGSIDEVRLWDEAISENVISSWMCDPIDLTHPNYNNLMGYWRLNDGTGNGVSDNSPSNLNGTLVSANWSYSTSCFGSPLLTYVPDDNFESYLEANGMGDGIALNDYVYTTAIEMVMFLDVYNQSITDLTGIEDFTVLQDLNCGNNQLTTLDVSQNTYLVNLELKQNSITSLDLSANTSIETIKCRDNIISNINISNNSQLVYLDCSNNQITNLSTIDNPNLEELYCSNNQIIYLDLSANSALTELNAAINLLISLNIQNGNNQNMSDFYSTWNSNLNCIEVDDVFWSTTNWTVANGNIDAQHYFSTDCSMTSVEGSLTSEKELLKITDVLGREFQPIENKTLFYIYEDGTSRTYSCKHLQVLLKVKKGKLLK